MAFALKGAFREFKSSGKYKSVGKNILILKSGFKPSKMQPNIIERFKKKRFPKKAARAAVRSKKTPLRLKRGLRKKMKKLK